MSTHAIEIVPIVLEPHGNADSLSICHVFGFTVVLRTADWQGITQGAYIPPDYMVSADRPEFAFLAPSSTLIDNNGVKGYRIKVKKLRGVMSMGLMIPAPIGSKIGDNVIDQLGIARYELPMPLSTFGEVCKAPPGVFYKYDVESAYRYKHLFVEGEEVVATEKTHGANGRWLYIPEEGMFCGSRTEWKRQDANNLWWKALAAHPEVEEWCKANPEICVYGEAFGQVQGGYTYGRNKGEVNIVVFDLLRKGQWVNNDEARELGKSLPWVPVIYRGPWSDKLFEMADGKSEIAKTRGADQIREGLVIKPLIERQSDEIGRVQLKIVSNDFLSKDK